MGFNLWWLRNDGIGGHVWLSAREMALLRAEMGAQRMTFDGIPEEKLTVAEGQVITPQEISRALAGATREPRTLEEQKLWSDWLAFLEGAAKNGGILVR